MASDRFPPISRSIFGTTALIGSTFGINAISTQNFTIMGPLGFLLLSLLLILAGLALIIWSWWEATDDPRPNIIGILGLLLTLLLYVISFQQPASFYPVLAGIVASLIIAVAASSRESILTT